MISKISRILDVFFDIFPMFYWYDLVKNSLPLNLLQIWFGLVWFVQGLNYD